MFYIALCFYNLSNTTAISPQTNAAHCPRLNFSLNSTRPHTSAASTLPAEMTGYITDAYSLPDRKSVQKLAAAFEIPAKPAKPIPLCFRPPSFSLFAKYAVPNRIVQNPLAYRTNSPRYKPG